MAQPLTWRFLRHCTEKFIEHVNALETLAQTHRLRADLLLLELPRDLDRAMALITPDEKAAAQELLGMLEFDLKYVVFAAYQLRLICPNVIAMSGKRQCDIWMAVDEAHHVLAVLRPLEMEELFDSVATKTGMCGSADGVEEVPQGSAADDGEEQSDGYLGPTHSSDFTSVDWFGQSYHFKHGQQAKAIACLWAEYENGGHGLSEKTIGERIDSSSDNFRLTHTFRSVSQSGTAMHPAWETMIQKVSRGVYKLVRLQPPRNTSLITK